MHLRSSLLILAPVLLAACLGDPADAPPTGIDSTAGGRVAASWEGADTVRMALNVAGTARWCEAGRWLELAAVRGDTGIMVALFPPDSLVRGRYPVALPVRDDSLRSRPAATVGIRWYTPGAVAGYMGWEGDVEVREIGAAAPGPETVSGRLEVRLTPAAGNGAITAEATFDRIPIHPADSLCAI